MVDKQSKNQQIIVIPTLKCAVCWFSSHGKHFSHIQTRNLYCPTHRLHRWIERKVRLSPLNMKRQCCLRTTALIKTIKISFFCRLYCVVDERTKTDTMITKKPREDERETQWKNKTSHIPLECSIYDSISPWSSHSFN